MIGRYIDEQKPQDVFFFEQDGAFVLRLMLTGQAGIHHELAEFTRTTSTGWSTRGPTLAVLGATAAAAENEVLTGTKEVVT